MTRVLKHCLKEAVELDDPIPALHESLQPIADSNMYQDFEWEIIKDALEDVRHHRQTLQGAASKAALEVTGLSIQQRL